MSDVMDRPDETTWGDLLGPAYSRESVASLLGRTSDEVDTSTDLLCLPQPSQGPGYPVFQFTEDGRIVGGLDDVLAIMRPVVATPWTIASWLASPQPRLDGARPIDELHAGHVQRVVDLARIVATHLARP